MRLSRRGIVVLSILTVTLLQGAAAGFARWWRLESEKALQAEQQALADAQRRNAARGEEETPIEPIPVGQTWSLLAGPDVAATLQRVNELGVDARATFDVIKASASNTPGKQAFQVAGRGTPQSVCEFLAAVERNERLMIVETGRFTPGDEKEVAFELAIATYHRGGGR